MSKQRNPVLAGAIGLVLLIGLTLTAVHFEDLPLIGGRTYSAEFTEAAGLKPDDEVRVAGVKAGEVTGMELEGNRVRVDFRVSDAWLGQRTTASIEIKTLLGQKYLALDPQGDQPLDAAKPIPPERTRTPYDVTEAFNGLASTAGRIDTAQLAESFRVMSETFRGSPAHVRDALDGLSALSRSVSSRDEQLAKLLSNTSQVSKLAADRNGEFQKLITDGNLLLGELRARREAITALLAGTRELSAQLRGVVADNQAQLTPALEKLDRITAMLDRNQHNLAQGLHNLAPFVRVFGNTVGNGPWFDYYMCGLVPPTVQSGPINVNPQGCQPPFAGQQGGPR